MQSSNQADRPLSLVDLAGVVPVLLIAAIVSIKFWSWDFDDGFIVYRYVEHIVSGQGWVYNPGEAYNASTSALNTILIAVLALAGLTPQVAAHTLGAVALALLGLSLYAVFLRYSRRWFAVLVACACVFMMGNNFTWGLESHLFYGLLSLYIALEVYGTTSWVLIGVLILVRPDAVLLAALRGGWSLARGEFPLRGLVLVGVVLAPWVAFSLYSFGNVFPATLQQKMWQGRSGFWGTGWIFVKGLIGYLRGDTFTHLAGSHWAPLVLGAPLILVPQGVLFCFSRRSPLLLLFLSISLVLSAYCLLNVPNYHWYYVGLIELALVFAACGVLFVTEQLPLRLPRVLDWVLMLVITGISIFGLKNVKTDFFDVRTDVYRQLAEKIAVQTPVGDRIAAVEVGVVGYYSRRPMIDIVGLTTPYGEFITGEHNARLFEELKPEVIIMHTPLMPHEQAVFGDPRFVSHYRQQDLVLFTGYPELSFFVRQLQPRQLSDVRFPMQISNRNNAVKKGENIFALEKGDPWVEYRLDSAQQLAAPVLALRYRLTGSRLREGQPVPGRVYVSDGNAGYSEDRAVPVMLEAGKEQMVLMPLTLPGSAQNKMQVIQQVRFDPVQDMALVDDTVIEVKSVVLSAFE